jgi:hypothetical protein
MKIQFALLPLLGLAVASLACGGAKLTSTPPVDYRYPPSAFQEADLIGTWDDGTANETVIIKADKTFKQIYDIPQNSYHYEGSGQWWVEHRPSGCVYVHFEGMRFYHGVEGVENGNRDAHGTLIPYWDPCEERYVTMPDSVIMRIASVPNLLRGIRLVHMMWDREGDDKFLRLILTSTSTQTPLRLEA